MHQIRPVVLGCLQVGLQLLPIDRPRDRTTDKLAIFNNFERRKTHPSGLLVFVKILFNIN